MKSISICLAAFTIFVIFTAGCTVIEEPVNLSSMPVSPQQKKEVAKKSDQMAQQESLQSSIDAALVWSQKYEQVLTEAQGLKKTNETMLADNSKLKEDILAKDNELMQVKKELKEANQVLLDMRLELNQWKKDILGFREEMKQSQQALLAATAKILRELGAEVQQIPAENVANAENSK